VRDRKITTAHARAYNLAGCAQAETYSERFAARSTIIVTIDVLLTRMSPNANRCSAARILSLAAAEAHESSAVYDEIAGIFRP